MEIGEWRTENGELRIMELWSYGVIELWKFVL